MHKDSSSVTENQQCNFNHYLGHAAEHMVRTKVLARCACTMYNKLWVYWGKNKY